jgi:hypothetical protein
MRGAPGGASRGFRLGLAAAVSCATLAVVICAGAAGVGLAAVSQGAPAGASLTPTFATDVAHDLSPPLRDLARGRIAPDADDPADEPEEGPVSAPDNRSSADGALQSPVLPATIPSTQQNFEGLSNQDNFDNFGFRVNPPDPNGEVGPNNYIEVVNLTFAVFDKSGNMLLGPVDTGTLWDNFAVPDCTDPSGDPVVLYDQFTDRWILSQFTTSGMNPDGTFNGKPFYNCVAISQTGDPTGAYFRYAFITDQPDTTSTFFPDYPKYGVWTDSYVLTSRDFGSEDEYGISVYGLEKNKMVNGQPARMVHFFIDGNDPDLLPLVGDGLLPADVDGKQKPKLDAAIPIVGTQDDNASYGAAFDALNIWDFNVKWRSAPTASLTLNTQLPTASFDSIFPCRVVPSTTPGVPATGRDCLPQPGVTDGSRFLDILSYRQRPTFRLAYRNFKTYESLVTNQSVEASPGIAGVRWYEIRRVNGAYSIYQQGTYQPADGVHRWMGSIAQDKKGDMGLGYSVVNGTDVFPGIRYTGRLAGDPLGQMTLGEGTIINGAGVQTTTNSRWGDYTDMTVDPVDDCTFWYVNEYYLTSGTAADGRPWHTRIASFKLPGC